MKNTTTSANVEMGSRASLDAFYEVQRRWRIDAWQNDLSFIPTVIPGYNDRATSGKDTRPVARIMEERDVDESDKATTWLASSLEKAQHLLDSELDNLLVINSFNNFQDDTQIYPVYGNPTTWPIEYTDGILYDGYEEAYFDLLSNRFGGSRRRMYRMVNRTRSLPMTRQVVDYGSWC